jgi:hypothetical protein
MIEAPTRAYFTVRNYRLRIGREANHRKSLCRSPFDWSLYVVDSYSVQVTNHILPAHQIRVHLQYLGYPIANDPVYSETKIWARSRPVILDALRSDCILRDQTWGRVVLTRHHQTNAPRQLYLPSYSGPTQQIQRHLRLAHRLRPRHNHSHVKLGRISAWDHQCRCLPRQLG